MTLPTLLELFDKSRGFLLGKGVTNARRECEWIFAQVLGLSRIELYTRFDQPIDPEHVDRLRVLIARRGRREPLAYVLGNQPFAGVELSVSAAVLVPRPETETMVEAILAVHDAAPRRVADIGTGSAAIAIALARARPAWRITAVEPNAEAIAVARANAARHAPAVEVVAGDLGHGLSDAFDLIVANLPYVAESERPLCDPETAHEPAMALFAADDGMALIRRLCLDAPRLLVNSGAELWLEHGFTQAERVRAAAPTGWSATSHRDDAGHERWTILRRP